MSDVSGKKILLTRFPLESAWGGEEEIHLLMAKILRKHGGEMEILTSCPHLLRAFRREKFQTFRETQKDITSKSQIFWSILSVPLFFIRGIFWLAYFRYVRKIRKVLFLTLIEKVCWTQIARVFGMKVFWGHHAPIGKWLSRNPYFFIWKFFSKTVEIVVPSEFMKKSLYDLGVQNSRIQVLLNTLPSEKDSSQILLNKNFDQEFQEFILKKIRAPLDIKNTIFIGSASRLSREKGICDLVSAAEIVLQKCPNAIFLSAGEGPEKEALERTLKEKKMETKYFFLDFLEGLEMKIFFRGIHIFVLPSHEEPFGIVLLEAMSAGKAVVAYSTGGIPDVLGNKNFGLCSSGNIPELAEKILTLSQDDELRKELGKENFARYQKEFAPELFEKKFGQIFSLY
ncbi:glycosyltransferase family 4 protein [Candidatus Peregrinibacteria bacterium]|nr:glycosyltransferase family 4 protein [Candidatus Peregrinibacteria bacterium]